MINGKNQVRAVILAAFFFIPALFPCSAKGASSSLQEIKRLLGSKDAALLADPSGRVIVGVNTDKLLVPASTLKLLTALVARHYLTEGYRFKTEFYVRDDGSLVIKGYGDPFLVSEEIQNIVLVLSKQMNFVRHIILDDTYFTKPLPIPGTIVNSLQPYDAPCGALSVNFNSFGFKIQDNQVSSAEPQTPLMDIARFKITSIRKRSNMESGRVPLADGNDEIPLYAGQLFEYFLKEAGIRVNGGIRTGSVEPGRDMLVYRHETPFDVSEIITRLLKNSNNFMANQLLLASGAAAFGPPATMEKAILAAKTYAATYLKMDTLAMVEGSGISRDNRLSAAMFLKILMAFKPCHTWMRHQDGEYYKTGTLTGVRARAGYLEDMDGRLFPFVVLINTPEKNTEAIMKRLKRLIR
ncbi:MAG: D-alanyl-D-alanine carboxypeptidase [Desulfobacteraceae bacterium]|nr:MAG: D-alanyl-D-alanine carboxypeptidase [Desulfobacteraceae bacterium]